MKNWHLFLWIVVAACGGFILGGAKQLAPEMETASIKPIEAEQTEVKFIQVEGDRVSLELKGDVRVVWSDEKFLEESGDLFLGQVPNANDLKYQTYPFVGNANTGKFYPSTTSWARGVRVKDRRFFATKEGAIAEGFIPSKSVK